jgi:hypothetical protein
VAILARDYTAYWNPGKLCWEISMVQPSGERHTQVLHHANVARRILKEQGVRYIDAHINVYNQKHMLLIVDPEWWVNLENDIAEWCSMTDNSLKLSGMVIEFDTKEDKMMFMLRW